MVSKLNEISALEEDGRDIGAFPIVNEVIRMLVRGPSRKVITHSQMWAQGRHFRIHALDQKKVRTSDAGVSASFQQESQSSASDQNREMSDLPYFGVIQGIYELVSDLPPCFNA
jgi:hypothetical protein